jgi:hypothetical protein
LITLYSKGKEVGEHIRDITVTDKNKVNNKIE